MTTQAEESRKFTAKQRKSASKDGTAMPDGSFPIKNATDLKNAIKLVGNSKNPAAAKAHIIKRAKKLGLTAKLPKGWTTEKAYADIATLTGIECPGEDCGRRFFTDEAFIDHAEKVHTFSDIERLVGQELREKFGRRGDYEATPPVSSIWVWISDIADDWVVYQVEGGDNEGLFQIDYTIDQSDNVTFGDPVEVVRRTVYDPVS